MNDKTIPKESGKTDEEKAGEIEQFDHTPPLNPREEMMRQMVSNSREAREESKKDMAEQLGMSVEQYEEHIKVQQPEPVADGELEDEELEEEEDVPDEELEEEEELDLKKSDEPLDKEPQISNNPIIERDGKQYLRTNVNGVFHEIPIDKVVETQQKVGHADQVMREAAEIKRKYDELLAQQQAEPTPPDADADAVDTEEVLKEALNEVYDGDIDTAAVKLAKILGAGRTPAPKPSAKYVSDEDARRLVIAEMEHRELQKSFNRFKSNERYKHITSDSVLMDRVDAFTEDLQRDPEFLKNNPSYDDFFTKAAELTEQWLSKVSGAPPKKEPSEAIDDNERLSRKRLTPKPPTPRTVRRGPKEEVNQFAKSKSDVIADMARRRGQTNF